MINKYTKLGILNILFFTFVFVLHVGLLQPAVTSAQTATAGLSQPCDEDGGVYCTYPLSCVNNVCIDLEAGSESGTVGQYCDVGSGIGCITGLNCGDNNKCYDPNTQNSGSGGNGGGSSGGGSSGGKIDCPAGLSDVNGICLPSNVSVPKTGIAGSSTLVELMTKVIQLLLTFAGIIAVVFLVLGGYWYMASGGNEELAEKGKKTIVNFVLGLVVIIMAYAIVTILFNTLTSDRYIP